MSNLTNVVSIPGLVSLWTFQEPGGSTRASLGLHPYTLREADGPVARVAPAEGAPFGDYAAELRVGQYFYIPRAECPALDIHGPTAQVSVVAWLQRHRKREVECEAIAGIWNETRKMRQYALFLDLRIHQAGDNVCGHVSSTGGPTTGHRWAMDAAIGASRLTYFDWHCAAFTYDGQLVRAWLDGRLETRIGFNPFAYPYGLYDAGSEGADFTVGAVHRGGEMGNWFVGRLGGLAVFNRALDSSELGTLTALLPSQPAPSPTLAPVLA
jgi:hypothetical protein